MRLGNSFRSLPPVTKNLLIINVIIWLAIQFFPLSTVFKLQQICALHYFSSVDFNPAQLVTYMFVHQDFFHLFFNMFALYMFGMIVERAMGGKRFLFYYLTCGIGAGLVQEGVFGLMISHYASVLPDGAVALIANADSEALANLINQNLTPLSDFGAIGGAISQISSLINVPVIGASGAVFGILLAFGYLFPRLPLYIMFIPVPIQARWVVIGYGAIELLQGISNNAGDDVAHFAHLGGMLFGLAMLVYWRRKGCFNHNPFV